MSESNKMGLKRCDQCDYKASNQAILRQHILRMHELGKYGHECQLCDKEFSRTNNLKRHIEQVHMSVKRFKCDQCQFETSAKATIKQHKSSKHEGITYKCDQCDKKFYDKKLLKHHILIEHDKFRFECSVCHFMCKTTETLKNHIQVEHENNPKLECDSCNKTFSTLKYLKMHKYHVHTRKIPCKECKQIFRTQSSLNRHHKAFHSDEIVHCEKCGIRSKNGIEAEKHRQANHNGIKYTCNQCDFKVPP